MSGKKMAGPFDSRKYYQRLSNEGKRRYSEKIFEIDGNDPFNVPARCWSFNPDYLPELSHIDMFNYFVVKMGICTFQQWKQRRNLEPYQLNDGGWVMDVLYYQPDDCPNVVISGTVLQDPDKTPLSPWIICSEEGTIVTSHCNCKAVGTEACTHVAALAFSVEAHTATKERARLLSGKVLSNLESKEPQLDEDVTPLPGYLIDFSSPGAKKNSVQEPDNDDGFPLPAPRVKVLPPTQAEHDQFLEKLWVAEPDAVIFSALPGYCEKFMENQRKKKAERARHLGSKLHCKETQSDEDANPLSGYVTDFSSNSDDGIPLLPPRVKLSPPTQDLAEGDMNPGAVKLNVMFSGLPGSGECENDMENPQMKKEGRARHLGGKLHCNCKETHLGEDVKPLPGYPTDFSSPGAKKMRVQERDNDDDFTLPAPSSSMQLSPPPSQAEHDTFLENMWKVNPDAVMFSTNPGYSEKYWENQRRKKEGKNEESLGKRVKKGSGFVVVKFL